MIIKKENLEYTSALIVLDFDQPWEMMNALTKWMGILSQAVLFVLKDLPIKEQDKLKYRLAKHINNYERFASEGNQESKAEEKKEKPSPKKK
jgi:hypothetical protein